MGEGPGSSVAVLVVMFRLSSQCADVILGWESGALSTLCFLNIEIGILDKTAKPGSLLLCSWIILNCVASS